MSSLEDRLQQSERVTGLRESDLDFSLSGSEPLTDRLTNITEQVTKLSDTVSKLCEEVELSKLLRELQTWKTSHELVEKVGRRRNLLPYFPRILRKEGLKHGILAGRF